MIHNNVFRAFAEELEKEAGWESAVRGIGKRLSKGWNRLDDAADFVGRGGTPATVARSVAGAGIGAAAGGEDGRISGAIVGGLAGGFAPTILRQTHRAGQSGGGFIANPAKSLRQGWQAHSPVGNLQAGEVSKGVVKRVRGETAKAYRDAVQDAASPGMMSKLWHGGASKARKARVKKTKAKWDHLVDEGGNVRNVGDWGQTGNITDRIQGVANELSRRGWTGQGTSFMGGATKYLPVGAKGLTTGFAALSAPTVYRSATGEIPLSTGAGEVGSNLAYFVAPATKGLGLVGTIGLSEAMRSGMSAPIEAVERRWHPQVRQGLGRNAVSYG